MIDTPRCAFHFRATWAAVFPYFSPMAVSSGSVKMPGSSFLTQNDRFSFNELVQASSLPSFVTDLSEFYKITPSGQCNIPISAKEATVTYYVSCLKSRKQEYRELFALL